MVQTPEGAKKAAKTNLAKDPDYYRKIGTKGGRANVGGLFNKLSKEELREVARRGGKAKAKRLREADDG